MMDWNGDWSAIERFVRSVLPMAISIVPGLPAPTPWPTKIVIKTGPRADLLTEAGSVDLSGGLSDVDAATAVDQEIRRILATLPPTRRAINVTLAPVYDPDTGQPEPPPTPFSREFTRVEAPISPGSPVTPHPVASPFSGVANVLGDAMRARPTQQAAPIEDDPDPFGFEPPRREIEIDPDRPIDHEAIRMVLDVQTRSLESQREVNARLTTQLVTIMAHMVESTKKDAERYAFEATTSRSAITQIDKSLAEASKERDMLRQRVSELQDDVEDLEEENNNLRTRAGKLLRRVKKRKRIAAADADPSAGIFTEVSDRVLKQVDAMITDKLSGGSSPPPAEAARKKPSDVAGDPATTRRRRAAAEQGAGGGAGDGAGAGGVGAGGLADMLKDPGRVADTIALLPGAFRDEVVTMLLKKHPTAGVALAEKLVAAVEGEVAQNDSKGDVGDDDDDDDDDDFGDDDDEDDDPDDDEDEDEDEDEGDDEDEDEDEDDDSVPEED